MLPGTKSLWTPDAHRLFVLETANQVGYEPILGPVASTNHIAGASRCHGYVVFAETSHWEE
jgi:hypothetical protein